MITCKLTGHLCNTILQMFATIAYAKKWKMPYAIPTTTTNTKWKHYRFPCIRYEDVNTAGFYHYKEPAIKYDQRPYNITFQEIPYHENIILEGHFLSHKYFEEYKDEIFPLLGFYWYPVFNAISLHQRRGDYLQMQEYLPVMPIEYYQEAVRAAIKLTGYRMLYVFGDDIEYNRATFTEENFPELNGIVFSQNKNPVADLDIMSRFPVNIIGNSTFSLTAHHLNQHLNKICIAPKNWYGPAYGEVDKTDLYPPNAIVL